MSSLEEVLGMSTDADTNDEHGQDHSETSRQLNSIKRENDDRNLIESTKEPPAKKMKVETAQDDNAMHGPTLNNSGGSEELSEFHKALVLMGGGDATDHHSANQSEYSIVNQPAPTDISFMSTTSVDSGDNEEGFGQTEIGGESGILVDAGQNQQETAEEQANRSALQLTKALSAISSITEEERLKMQLLVSHFSKDQLSRYEMYRRSAFPKAAIRKIIQQTAGVSVTPNVVIAIAGIAKVFAGEVIEEALDSRDRWKESREPLKPKHIREALRRLKNRGQLFPLVETAPRAPFKRNL